MSSDEWASRRQPKRGRSAATAGEESKTNAQQPAPAPPPAATTATATEETFSAARAQPAPPQQQQPQAPPPRPPQGGGDEDSRFRSAYSDYPTMFPPPPAEGGQPPYMHPMHAYPPSAHWPPAYPPMGYGMYPPYGHPHAQPGFPPPYGQQGMHAPPYYQEHAAAAQPPHHSRYPHDPGVSPTGAQPPPPHYASEGGRGLPPPAPSRERAAAGRAYDDHHRHHELEGTDSLGGSHELPEYDEEEDKKRPADTSSASRARLYVKSKVPTRQEILDRRARKNSQSRARAAKLRQRVEEISLRPESERTEEEKEIFAAYQYRRQRKNNRSRERAIEKKTEIERILSKPESKRSKIENDFLETALSAKQRKNQGDRLRRQRIKQMKRAQARAEGEYAQRLVSAGYPPNMSDIPMSPLPTPGAHLHPSMASPPLASPGMGMTFPSPARRPQHGATAASRPPGVPLSFGAPSQAGYGTGDSPGSRSQLHMPQPSSNVEQRRNPDGSMSISIGAGRTTSESAAEGGAAESSFAEGASSGQPPSSPGEGTGSNTGGNVNLNDVSQLLMYENNEEQEGGEGGSDKAEV